MTNIEAVRAWLRTYPPLASGRLGVDFLPPDAQTYSVEVTPCKEVIKRYRDGSAIKQFDFVLASREFYQDDIAQNTDNLSFYEDFAQWVEKQNRRTGKHLPRLAAGRDPQRVEVTSTGYPFLVDEQGTARYQIQMKLTYYQKGDR